MKPFLAVLTVLMYVVSFALFLALYYWLDALGMMHPTAFSAFFLATFICLISFLWTRLRVELSVASLALAIASIYLACADGGCETAMAMFTGFAVLFALWTATVIYWRYCETSPRMVALLWRYGVPFVFIQIAIGMYFQFYPIAR